MAWIDNYFEGIEDESIESRVPFFDEGEYTVQVERVEHYKSRKRKDLWRVYTRVMASTNPKVRQGSERLWQIDMNLDGARRRIKQFVVALLGEEVELTAETFVTLCSEKQPATGVLVDVVAEQRTSSEGKTYLSVAWSASNKQAPVPF